MPTPLILSERAISDISSLTDTPFNSFSFLLPENPKVEGNCKTYPADNDPKFEKTVVDKIDKNFRPERTSCTYLRFFRPSGKTFDLVENVTCTTTVVTRAEEITFPYNDEYVLKKGITAEKRAIILRMLSGIKICMLQSPGHNEPEFE